METEIDILIFALKRIIENGKTDILHLSYFDILQLSYFTYFGKFNLSNLPQKYYLGNHEKA